MPTVFRYEGFRFYFFSNEGDPREPVHVHVRRDGIEAKFWVIPEVLIAYNSGYSPRTLRELVQIVEANRESIVRSWNGHFGS
jgi:hypothetical protein